MRLGWGGRASLPVAAWGALWLAGCCSIPPASRYFERHTPYNAVSGFAYAVETGQYDFAYQTLTPRSRELIAFSRFKFALRFGVEVPELGVNIREVIVSSERHPAWQDTIPPKDPHARHAFVMVHYLDPERTEQIFEIYLERDDPEEDYSPWRIDLERTIASWKGEGTGSAPDARGPVMNDRGSPRGPAPH